MYARRTYQIFDHNNIIFDFWNIYIYTCSLEIFFASPELCFKIWRTSFKNMNFVRNLTARSLAGPDDWISRIRRKSSDPAKRALSWRSDHWPRRCRGCWSFPSPRSQMAAGESPPSVDRSWLWWGNTSLLRVPIGPRRSCETEETTSRTNWASGREEKTPGECSALFSNVLSTLRVFLTRARGT